MYTSHRMYIQMYHIAGLSKSEKVFEKKSSTLTGSRLLEYMWELKGWRDLKEKNSELKESLERIYNKGTFTGQTGTLKYCIIPIKRPCPNKCPSMFLHKCPGRLIAVIQIKQE